MFGKQGKTDKIFLLILGLVVILVIGPAKVQNFVGGLLGWEDTTVPPVTPPPVNGGGTCVDPTVKVSMTLTAEDFYNPGTVPGGDARVWLDGNDQGFVANGNSLTVSPGSSYVILWADNSTSYYTRVTKGTVPCAGTLKPHEKLYAIGDNLPAATFANVYNEKGQVGSAAQTAAGTYYNITINAGDMYTVNFELKGQYRHAYGNPYIDADEGNSYNIIGCHYNKTAFAAGGVVIDLDNAKSESVSCPVLADSAVGWTYTCVTAPSIVSNGKLSGSLTLQSDATNSPSEGGWVSDVQCFYWDADYVRHTVSNEILKGVVDNVNTNLGMPGALNFTFHVA